jgi:hypothetical protein
MCIEIGAQDFSEFEIMSELVWQPIFPGTLAGWICFVCKEARRRHVSHHVAPFPQTKLVSNAPKYNFSLVSLTHQLSRFNAVNACCNLLLSN